VVSGTRRELGEAIRRSAFTKGFKQDVKVTADLVETTETPAGTRGARRTRHCRKAKEVVTGFGKSRRRWSGTASRIAACGERAPTASTRSMPHWAGSPGQMRPKCPS